MYRDIQNCVRSLVEERRMRVIVVIDEAHLLHASILRDLQMLTNFDMDSKDMFALVLVGHSVLAQYLNRQPYDSLRQRLVVNYRMRGMDEAATRDYVRSMLLKSGADPDIFDDAAIASAHGASGRVGQKAELRGLQRAYDRRPGGRTRGGRGDGQMRRRGAEPGMMN